MNKIIKKIIDFLYFRYLILKCDILYRLYGGDGLGTVIEIMPKLFIVPILKRFGVLIGSNCKIQNGLVLHNLKSKDSFKHLTIGNNVYIGRNVLIDLKTDVIFEDDIAIGAGSQIWTHVGDFTVDFSDYYEKISPVRIGKGVLCWSKVIISPGITIGNYSRVAAGSVITKNIEPKSFVGGVPAKFIRKIEIDLLDNTKI